MSDEKYAFLGTYGGVEAPATLSTDQLLRIAGANSGNFMFQYAADRTIAGDHIFVGESGRPYNDASARSGASHLVVPAANHFRIGANWTELCNFIENSNLPVVMLGLGAQAPKTEDIDSELSRMLGDPHLARLGQCLAERAVLVTVRGEFSAKVCSAFGISRTLPLGCPSLLINPEPRLGRRIRRKLNEAAEKARETSKIKMGLTAASPFEIMGSYKMDIEQVLFQMIREMNGLYIQQSGGNDTVAFAMRRFDEVKLSAALSFRRILDPKVELEVFFDFFRDRGRIYWDVETWMAGIRPLDLVIGTRLHGNMAALAADVPGVVITHDARTSELVDTMKLPYLSAEHCKPGASMADLFENVVFDEDAFDANRRDIAVRLHDAFVNANIKPSLHLEKLSGRVEAAAA